MIAVNEVTIHDKKFALYISEEDLQQRIAALAEEIGTFVKEQDPIVIPVLNGAFIFAADLLRQIDCDPQIHFVKLASYREMQSSGNVRALIGLEDEVIHGRSILIVEDIIDTGNTLEHLRRDLLDRGARDVTIATMLLKSEVFDGRFPVEFVGFEIPEAFVVGYGLDFDGFGRSLKGIYQLVPDETLKDRRE